MPNYDKLLHEAPIPVYDAADLPANLKGLYVETKAKKVILLDKRRIRSRVERTCILAEELGHYYKTSGNIIDQAKLENRKQELLARSWAYEKLVPLSAIIEAHKAGIRNRYEFAERLQVTEEFLMEAIKRYTEKYGLYKKMGKFTISFEPLGVVEMFE
ncbi:ImmA/IrrE family metallo-endopeptidase [Paenibacillus sp.]|uniref:ImmA/IrrE family metallo-endopeptidase n=1 Tax=Paenibacillus sp. TaxID=58172 RepID=UPI002D62B6A9|nr:ImmA/IrrE family metallo-endopeptidase [Paenibacillus sp.]HZG83873.1 ImmA/IrrE family metallo-endopeptidase [Paenibacillus sp.]